MDRIILILIALFVLTYFFVKKETFNQMDRNKQSDTIHREQNDRFHKLIFG
jgi:hypothetical protein